MFVLWPGASELDRLGSTPVSPTNSLAVVNRMSADDRGLLQRFVAEAATEVSQILGAAPRLVHSNLFGLDAQGQLGLAPAVSHNMTNPDEATLRLEVGLGSTGLAFSTGKLNIAVLKDGTWGDADIAADQLAKIDPRLRWIISWPVLSEPHRTPIFVLNVDGLYGPPDINQLQVAAALVAYYAQLVALIAARSAKTSEEQ